MNQLIIQSIEINIFIQKTVVIQHLQKRDSVFTSRVLHLNYIELKKKIIILKFNESLSLL